MLACGIAFNADMVSLAVRHRLVLLAKQLVKPKELDWLRYKIQNIQNAAGARTNFNHIHMISCDAELGGLCNTYIVAVENPNLNFNQFLAVVNLKFGSSFAQNISWLKLAWIGLYFLQKNRQSFFPWKWVILYFLEQKGMKFQNQTP